MNFENLKFNLDTKLVLNIGCPIGKTNAPRVYNKLFSRLGMNAVMLPAEIEKGRLPQFMDACKTLGIRYFSPTMPHKADIIPLLDDVDESSRLFQSVNAVYIDESGISHGVGMDGKGAVQALLDSGVAVAGKTAFLLGTGSVSGVIGLELARNGVEKLTMLNRTPDKAERIAEILRRNTAMEVEALESTPDNLDKAAAGSDLFLQCSPLGMAGYGHTHAYLGFIEKMPRHGVVFDVIINPPDTPVIAAAKALGMRTVPGMKMLAGQMDVIFHFMFGVRLDGSDKQACIEELCEFLEVQI